MLKKIFFGIILTFTGLSNLIGQNVNYEVDNYFEYNEFAPQLNGYLGKKLNLAISNGVKERNIEAIVEPFKHREETWMWQSEFWGKWITSAILSYEYTKDPELLSLINKAYDSLVSTQSSDGYIGNYRHDSRLKEWDIWGRKYVLLGLLAYYDLNPEKNKQAIDAAKKLADNLIAEIRDRKSVV